MKHNYCQNLKCLKVATCKFKTGGGWRYLCDGCFKKKTKPQESKATTRQTLTS